MTPEERDRELASRVEAKRGQLKSAQLRLRSEREERRRKEEARQARGLFAVAEQLRRALMQGKIPPSFIQDLIAGADESDEGIVREIIGAWAEEAQRAREDLRETKSTPAAAIRNSELASPASRLPATTTQAGTTPYAHAAQAASLKHRPLGPGERLYFLVKFLPDGSGALKSTPKNLRILRAGTRNGDDLYVVFMSRILIESYRQLGELVILDEAASIGDPKFLDLSFTSSLPPTADT
jgi:hypothetical protein